MFQKQPPEVFCKKRCSWKFKKFTGKPLCQSLFLNNVAGLQLYQKRDSGTDVFLWILWNFQEQLFDRTPMDDCFWETKLLTMKVLWDLIKHKKTRAEHQQHHSLTMLKTICNADDVLTAIFAQCRPGCHMLILIC